jgi:glutamyl-tRNA synthetase
MLAVVVDDHDMAVTHVIRGDDHLSNAFRQRQIYESMGWTVPAFAHIPLIHGADGAKLSKRHGALGVEAYRDLGYLPQALRNYLLRLGWGHGDAEIISDAQAIEWFDVGNVGRNPARFDFAKLDSLNAHYLRTMDPDQLLHLLLERMEKDLGQPLERAASLRVAAGLEGLRVRAKTLVELAQAAQVYVASRPIRLDTEAQKLLQQGREALAQILPKLEAVSDWKQAELEQVARGHAETSGLKLGAVAQPLRAAVTGSKVSPPIFEVMGILGREESLARLRDCLAAAA